MCGRFVQASSPALLVERFAVDEVVGAETFEAHYNLAPRMDALTIVEGDDVRRLGPMRWGLVPSWAESPAVGDRLINARAETLVEKPAFKPAFERRRCIIPADGFYEWQAAPGPRKQPMYIHARDGSPLAFAGLWESWRDRTDPEAPWIRTCVVITTDANAMMRPVHDRMPAMLATADWDQWLDREFTDGGALLHVLCPAPDDLLAMHPVSTRVNGARNDDASLILREDPLTLFP